MKNIFSYRYIICYLLLLMLLSRSGASAAVSGASDELYNKGIEALKVKDTLRAVLLFKESIRENSDAPSYFELAKIDIAKNTFVSRNRAFENLRIAVSKDPANLTYKYEYAKICNDFARYTAIDLYKEILKMDSTQIEAWVKLGEMKERDFTEYDQSFRNVDGILAPLQKYADEDMHESENYYKNALALDSINYDASIKLSLLYEKSGRADKAIPILKRIIEHKRDDQKIHLCLGLMYYKNSRIKESYDEYKKALEMMNANDRKDFTVNSVKFLLEARFDDVMKNMNDYELEDFIELYWKVSEPLYLTPYNERLLEHYSRVAYSNLHFSVPKMNITGWKSNRGEVVLRYGEPESRIRMRPQMGNTKVEVKTDVWNYKNFTFGFTDMAQSGNFIFSAPAAEKDKTASQFAGDTSSDINNLRKNYFYYYEPKFEGPKFEAPVSIAQFKNPVIRNHTDVVISYGLDAADSLLSSGDYAVDHELGVFFIDKNYDVVNSLKERTEQFDSVNDQISYYDKKLVVNSMGIPMVTDSGIVAVEIKRIADGGISANRSNIKIRKFSNYNLDISSLILASRVEREKTSDRFVNRKDIFIQPNPLMQFKKDNPPYLYYEVYNLKQTNSGLTSFIQKINISKINDGESGVKKAFNSVLNVLGIGKEDENISLTSSYQTREKDPQIYLQLDLSRYPEGKYLVEIHILDNLSGKEVETKAFLDWRD